MIGTAQVIGYGRAVDRACSAWRSSLEGVGVERASVSDTCRRRRGGVFLRLPAGRFSASCCPLRKIAPRRQPDQVSRDAAHRHREQGVVQGSRYLGGLPGSTLLKRGGGDGASRVSILYMQRRETRETRGSTGGRVIHRVTLSLSLPRSERHGERRDGYILCD
jgi:hypothetical protein